MRIPTVSIVHPDDPTVLMTINEADLRADHVLWHQPEGGVGLRITKGPRGKWYVKRGADTVAGPFETDVLAEEAATAA